MEMVTHYGRSSYTIRNDTTEVFTSVLGGNTVAYFKIDGRTYCPYFIAPWWNEPWLDIGADLLNVCRGNFFCLPMGGDPDAISGNVIPVHGYCANQNWMTSSDNSLRDTISICIEFREPNGGKIKKTVEIQDEFPVIYETNTITGYNGKYPVAYHPMIELPSKPGQAHLGIGSVIDAYTTRIPHENPAQGGYYLFLNGMQIDDMKKVPTIFGDFEDLTSQPIREGFEDVVILLSDKSCNISYATVTNHNENYLYFQLKVPSEFQSTMLWISNGGRHYPPWNGRTKYVLGIEETTSYFHYGLMQSRNKNFLNDQGYQTSYDFLANKKYTFRLASGIIKTPTGFSGVEKMEIDGDNVIFMDINGLTVKTHINRHFFENHS